MAKCTDVSADTFAQCIKGKIQRQSAEARVNAQQSGSREYGNLVRHTRAALTCSEDEAITQVLCTLSQVPRSVSSSTSLTAVLDLYTP
jgi:hypothetical protein